MTPLDDTALADDPGTGSPTDPTTPLLTEQQLRQRRRKRRRPSVLALSALLLAVLVAASGWLLVRDRGRIAQGTTVAGIDVGGLAQRDARRVVHREAAARAAAPIVLVGDGAARTVTAARLGARPLVDDALALADEAGPLERVLGHLAIGGRDVPLRFALERERVAEFASELDASFGRPPRDARVRVVGLDVVTRPAVEGAAVDRGALNTRLRKLAPRVRIPLRPVAPTVSTAAADAARARAATLIARARVVRLGPARVTIRRQTLRKALRFRSSGSTIEVALDTGVIGRRLRQTLGGLEREPEDARFTIDGDRVSLLPSTDGRALDVEGIARALAADVDRRVYRTKLLTVRPALTTAGARALRVREPVAAFTTEYPCCAPRVTNIQRAAQLLDGALVRPGTTFSLNDALDRRTKARGFVEAPQIYAGRLEDAVGGGVSQVATTMYNAAFFAGMQLLAHSPHQFYISRYPMGREATVSWGGPELIFKNDWPAGVLLQVSATDTSITVRLFSSRLGRRVETTTGEPYDYVQPITRTVTNYEKPAGSREQVQDAGDPGFSVEVTRKVYAGDRLRRTERWTVDYDAQDAIVELGPPD